MEHKKQTGHVCRWMVFGITIVTIVVGCTIVIGLFEWRDRSRMESRNAETHLWRKNVYDLNMRVAKLSLLGETWKNVRHIIVRFLINTAIQYNTINSIARHPSPCRRYAHRLRDAQASRCCSQALGKFLLTFPVCSTFHCMTVSTNRYHQHLT